MKAIGGWTLAVLVPVAFGCGKGNEPSATPPAGQLAEPRVSGLPADVAEVRCSIVDASRAEYAPPSSVEALGPVVEVQGTGQLFDEPAVLELPLARVPSQEERERLYVATQLEGRWFPLAARPEVVEGEKPVVRIPVRHFSPFVVLLRAVGYGLPRPEGIEQAEMIVILIHGLDSGPDTWAPMERQLREKTGSGTAILAFSYPNDQRLKRSAHYLKAEIDALRARNPNARIDLVTHSMGGLVARYYVEKLGGDREVKSLLMIAPPNHGSSLARFEIVLEIWEHLAKGDLLLSPLGLVLDGAGQAARDLDPQSEFLRELNDGWQQPPGVEYEIIAGTRSFPGLSWKEAAELRSIRGGGDSGGDGAVSVKSAVLHDIEIATCPFNHMEIHRRPEVIARIVAMLEREVAQPSSAHARKAREVSEVLASEDVRRGIEASRQIDKLKIEEKLEVLLVLSGDSRASTRLFAVKTLRNIADARAKSRLAELASNDPDPDVRELASLTP